MRRMLVTICLLTLVSQADAATRRIAVLVGNNSGQDNRPHLRYAEKDAEKLARVLSEVGQVADDDLFLLQGSSPSEVERIITQVTKLVAESHRSPEGRAVLIFYFSGHSDGVALELGQKKLSFRLLRRLLGQTGADVRVLIVDACKSGAATLTKGGKPAPPFTIRLTDDLNTSGEVILASSAADEVSLESSEVQGSFFTHHLVSGLLGAADISADRRITLSEAYRYAYDHTVSSSMATLDGPFHPTYNMRLAGEGELILSYLDRVASGIRLPDGFDRALITRTAGEQVVAELTASSAHSLALSPGDYSVQVVRRDEAFAARVEIPPGQIRRLGWSDFKSTGRAEFAMSKGRVIVSRKRKWEPSAWCLAVSGGVAQGAADQVWPAGVLRLVVNRGRPAGWSLALQGVLGPGPEDSFYEQMIQLRAGYSFGFAKEWFGAWIGMEAGPGFVWQTVDRDVSGTSFLLTLGPRLGMAFRLTQSFEITIEGEAMLGILELDNSVRPIFLPSVLLGFLVVL